MAALDTFEWLVKQFWPNPDAETKKMIENHRDTLLNIRNENERLLYIEELMEESREAKKKKLA